MRNIITNCFAWSRIFRLAAGATLAAFVFSPQIANAQYEPIRPFQGKIGKTIETKQQSWTERVKAPNRSRDRIDKNKSRHKIISDD